MTTPTPELFLFPLPYTVARIATRGLMLSVGNPDLSLPAGPALAERARRGHANAIENLVYAAGILVIRTQAFIAGWVATLNFAANLLGL